LFVVGCGVVGVGVGVGGGGGVGGVSLSLSIRRTCCIHLRLHFSIFSTTGLIVSADKMSSYVL